MGTTKTMQRCAYLIKAHKAVMVPLTESITNSFVQFTDLKVCTADRCSSTNEFLIGAVRRSAPIIIVQSNCSIGE